ncbi:MAG: GlxA family transcriptional regulator [Gammaproteobacteria bacterium]|nr:GlxA family transcriptional regulator [Gammaproteobacteria bacterium]
MPQFTLLAFSSAIEVLRMANQLAGKELYRWRVYSKDGQSAQSSCGINAAVDGAAESIRDFDMVFVVGGININRYSDPHIHSVLRKIADRRVVLGALCTGSYVLARAELLSGYRCTIHWENIAAIREEFPSLVVSQELFEFDRDRITCAGGIAPLDMMMHIVRQDWDERLASSISEMFMAERIRDKHDRQRVPLMQRIGTGQPKLAEAVSLMEANIEEPMTLDELSGHVNLSRRQLERLFKKYLNVVPTRYYLDLRLERARQLLLQTSMPIVDIALACGFVSAPHFSKCYRDIYGVPPRDERRRGQLDISR